MKTKNHLMAVHRIINSVWTLVYEQKEDGVHIIQYSRDIEAGYEMERSLPKCELIENDERTVTGVKIDGKAFPVTNPQHVFSYNG